MPDKENIDFTIEPISGVSYVALYGEQKHPIGSIVFDDKNNTLRALWVDPEYRKNGIATQLVERVLADIKEGKYPNSIGKEIAYFCHIENEASMRIPQKLGFEQWGFWFKVIE